jgi:hypothetical protein
MLMPANTLTVVHHDDSTTDYDDVRYELTTAGVRILDATGETTLPQHQVLTVHATRRHHGGEDR